jgi:ribosome-binding factor A
MGKSLERLSSLIKQKIAQVVLQELKDPRVGFVTITRVKLAPDLSNCLVFYSVLGGKSERSKTHHALADARGYVQRRIGQTLETRTVPHLQFEYDESIEGAIRMGKLLHDLGEEQADDPEDEGADSGDSKSPENP